MPFSTQVSQMSDKHFRITFSYAGEKRDFVAQVAGLLAEKFSQG
jgi:hypothetical protein